MLIRTATYQAFKVKLGSVSWKRSLLNVQAAIDAASRGVLTYDRVVLDICVMGLADVPRHVSAFVFVSLEGICNAQYFNTPHFMFKSLMPLPPSIVA